MCANVGKGTQKKMSMAKKLDVPEAIHIEDVFKELKEETKGIFGRRIAT